jgi:glycosyltransferase involved in cell wall biosynthesis
MNVLLAAPWDQAFGGVASVVGNLAACLSKSGHQVVFLYPGDANRLHHRSTAWGFSGYDLNLRSPFIRERPIRSIVAFLVFLLPTLYQLGRVIRAQRIQIVNIHYPLEAFVYLGVLRWFLPIRLVVSVHGADLFPDGQWRRGYPWSLKGLLFSSDAVVAPSRAFLKDCLLAFPGIAKKASFIHNGIDIRELARADGATGPVDGRQYLLCIAASNQKKALDVLLRAFAQVSETHRVLRLLLVGDGPLRRQHEELARSLSLQDRVEFLGWRGRAEVARLLQDCEIFVLPSRSEPFGLVVAEALACGKAVVASAVGGIPEIIEDGRSGVLVEPDQPAALARELLALLADDSLRESLGQAGYERVTQLFSCEAMSARYEGLYSSLLSGSREADRPRGRPRPRV